MEVPWETVEVAVHAVHIVADDVPATTEKAVAVMGATFDPADIHSSEFVASETLMPCSLLVKSDASEQTAKVGALYEQAIA